MNNKDIITYNEKGQVHGVFVNHDTNGSLGFIIGYINGVELGYEEYFHYDDNNIMVKRFYLI